MRWNKLLFTLAFWMLSVFLIAQEKTVSGNLDSKLPVDPNVKVGKLDNGLTYYIRQNEKPEDKVELRLVVNAGSMLEEESQQGLAHFLEHMAFNGTKNFAKNDLVDYLQSVGVKFGADLNAYTSFDETVYILPIPSDDEEILDKGLMVLEDWAHNISLNPEDIDAERGVVIEEWRLGQGASQRMRDKYFPVLFANSRYAERLPIGKKEIIENFHHEELRKFYKDWYRPDLMAVIAVGDIDPAAMEKKIKERFGNIKAVKKPKKREFYDVPDHEGTLIKVVTDPEAPFTQIQLMYKQDKEYTSTMSEFRRDVVYRLYAGMLNQRLDELKQSANPPFIFASSGYGSMVRTKDNYSGFAVVGEEGIENGLKTLIVENERVKKFGFTPSELERYKAEMLNRMEKQYNESDKTESRMYASEYIRNFLDKEPIPGIAFEYDFYKKILPTISVEEINVLAKRWISNDNRVVIITGPEKEGATVPDEAEIEEIIQQAEAENIAAYEDAEVSSSFMEKMPVAGKVVETRKFEDLGITEVTLSNGVKVVLKPTDFKNDEILMRAFSFGGQSLYPDEDDNNASFASQIISESGVADFSMIDMGKMLSGKTVSVSPYVGALAEGFNGSAAPKDLETMLQLVHLYFTDPRKDQESFESFKSKNVMLMGNLMSNPQFYYSDQVSKILTQNHPRGGGFPSVEDFNNINFDRSYEIYKERFADASDFTFVLVGNFDTQKILPQLETYLGSLPAINRNEQWKDLGVRPPKGSVSEVVNKGTDQKSTVTMVFTNEEKHDRQKSYYLSSLGELLTNKLIELLREEKGGVYGVGASGSMTKYPYEHYTFTVGFPCSPDNVDELVNATLDQIRDIQKNGVSEEDLQKIKETQKRERKDNLKENNYWLGQLYNYYYNARDLSTFYNYEDEIEKLSAKDLQNVAKELLNTDEYIKIVLMPEKSE